MFATEPSDSYYAEIDWFDECELHADQLLQYVCLECGECCICDECSMFIHASHRKQKLTEYNRNQLEMLEHNRRRLMEATTESQRQVRYLSKQIVKSRRMSAVAVEQATITAEYLWREILRKKDELIRNVDRYTAECANQLGQQKKELQHRLKQYKLIFDRIENVKKSDHPSQIFKTVGGIKKHCSGALNLKPLRSLPVYRPVFERNPNLLSDFGEIQIGVVLNSTDHSDDVSEEEDDDDYVVEEDPWIYEVKPLPVDTINDGDGDMTHQDNASAGSSYCQQSGSEVNGENASHTDSCNLMPDCTDNSSAGSSYAHFSETNLKCKRHNLEGFSEIEPGCSDTVTGHYSFAHRTTSLKRDNSIKDGALSPSVDITVDNEHDENDPYESLRKENDTFSSMLRDNDKYDSLVGSTLSLDRTQLPKKFQLYFKKSQIIQTENTFLSGKVLKRVFLPFTFTGFTVVSRENDTLLAFVTTENEVVLLRKNGVEFSRITELTSPFDVGSNGSFPYSIYITDNGSRHGEGSIRVYSCAGGYLDTFAGGLNAPRGIDLSEDGHVFVCDQADKCVYGFSPKGRKTLRLNIGGNGFPKYVCSLRRGRLAVSDNERENLIIYDIAGQKIQLVRTKVGDILCSGMCSEDVCRDVLLVVHPGCNSLHVIRGDQHEVIDLGGCDDARPLVPIRDERGNVFVF